MGGVVGLVVEGEEVMVRMGTKGRWCVRPRVWVLLLLWGSWWKGRREWSLGVRWVRKGGRERREGQIRMVVISASLFLFLPLSACYGEF